MSPRKFESFLKIIGNSIPFSSQAGIILTHKTAMAQKEIDELLKCIEDYYPAKQDKNISNRSKPTNISEADTGVIRLLP